MSEGRLFWSKLYSSVGHGRPMVICIFLTFEHFTKLILHNSILWDSISFEYYLVELFIDANFRVETFNSWCTKIIEKQNRESVKDKVWIWFQIFICVSVPPCACRLVLWPEWPEQRLVPKGTRGNAILWKYQANPWIAYFRFIPFQPYLVRLGQSIWGKMSFGSHFYFILSCIEAVATPCR